MAEHSPGSADDIRAAGWHVAVHNDYRLNGLWHTFWLFTRGSQCIVGEARTDVEALDIVRRRIKLAGMWGETTSERQVP